MVLGATRARAAVALAVLLAAGLAACDQSTPPPAVAPAPTTTVAPAPQTRAMPPAGPTDPLTGGRVVEGPVLAVKVENIGLARPQVGLHQADVVLAEQVEGAQTRLVAVYHTRFPKRLGPVRSARSTDVQLLPLFGRPGLVYSGANRSVQAKIDAASIVPIQRSTRDPRRAAPHNVFVDLASLAKSQTKVGDARALGWTFSADPDQADAGQEATRATSRVGHDTFRFDWSGGRWTVRWNGKTYVDGDDGKKTVVDNVVALRVHDHPDGNRDVLGAPSVQSDTVGSGKVRVYRDGRRIDGSWRRAKAAGPMTLTGADGQPIALHPGQTWVTLQG